MDNARLREALETATNVTHIDQPARAQTLNLPSKRVLLPIDVSTSSDRNGILCAMSNDTAAIWDRQAATFDDEPGPRPA